jgi:hypothetical protein
MTWFKVDDNLAFHPKVISAGNEAMGVWVRAGAWSGQQLTDGFVPDQIVSIFCDLEIAERLVEANLWEREEGGYRFKDWIEYQPTKDRVVATREQQKERMRLARLNISRPTRIPADFKVTPEMEDWCQENRPDLDVHVETAKFVDYWRSKPEDNMKMDWLASWRDWMRRERATSKKSSRMEDNLSIVYKYMEAES